MANFIDNMVVNIAQKLVQEDEEVQMSVLEDELRLKVKRSLIDNKPFKFLGKIYNPIDSLRKINEEFGLNTSTVEVEERVEEEKPEPQIPLINKQEVQTEYLNRALVLDKMMKATKNLFKKHTDRKSQGEPVGKVKVTQEEVITHFTALILNKNTEESKKYLKWANAGFPTRSPVSVCLHVVPFHADLIVRNIKLGRREEFSDLCKSSEKRKQEYAAFLEEKEKKKWIKVSPNIFFIQTSGKYTVRAFKYKENGEKEPVNSPHFRTELEAINFLAEHTGKKTYH